VSQLEKEEEENVSNPVTAADEPLDYSFLLVTHMVCADRQIHSKELKYLHKLERQAKVGQRTREEKEKILAQDEHLIPVEVLAKGLPQRQRNRTMAQMLEMAYIDGFYSPSEHQRVESIRQIWNWSVDKIKNFLEPAQAYFFCIADDSTPGNNLSENPEYQRAILRCAKIAHEDFIFAEAALKKAGATLEELQIGIQEKLKVIEKKTIGNSRAETAKEVAQQLEATKQSLEVEIVKKIQSVRDTLDAKQRSIDYFTVAFMGKTKAGKSTLHAIMTGEGWDAIGVGKQRTTRLNRVYEWKNIRIIDTPGIGAPGGKSDEQIAQSIINESDVICYVVTNDSQQETDFNFLGLLKENAKPLAILLNVHKNFRDSRRGSYEVERFLKNPEKLFAMDGASGLGGHIERIRRYARQHYGNDYFDIVPVMLLAAHLSYEPQNQHLKDQLFKASQMQKFLDYLWLSIVEYGDIRRSQNLLGCTVGDMEKPYKWSAEEAKKYKILTKKLTKERETIKNKIKQATNDSGDSLKNQIASIFQAVLNDIPSFAESHWDYSETAMKEGWEQELRNLRFEKRMYIAYQEAITSFTKEVQASLEEVGRELQLIANLGGLTFTFDQQDTGNERKFLQIGGGILAVAGTLMAFIPPLMAVGLVVGIVGGVISFIGGLFKDKAEKRREAVDNISRKLREQVNNQRQTTVSKALEQFVKACEDVKTEVDTYFRELIEGLDAIALQLQSAQSKLEGEVNQLNRAYAKRIIDWGLKRYEPLTQERIDRVIAQVNREFGRTMIIKTKSLIQLERNQKEINDVLQEKISYSKRD